MFRDLIFNPHLAVKTVPFNLKLTVMEKDFQKLNLNKDEKGKRYFTLYNIYLDARMFNVDRSNFLE